LIFRLKRAFKPRNENGGFIWNNGFIKTTGDRQGSFCPIYTLILTDPNFIIFLYVPRFR